MKAAGAPSELGIRMQLRHRLGRAAPPHSELRGVVKKEVLCKSLIQLCSEKLSLWLSNPKRSRQPREMGKGRSLFCILIRKAGGSPPQDTLPGNGREEKD